MLKWIKKLYARFFTHRKEKFFRGRSYTAHYTMKNLLAELDAYMKCLKDYRRVYPESYSFNAAVGGVIAPKKIKIIDNIDLEPIWLNRKTRPSTGMIFFTEDDSELSDHEIYPSFGCFRKNRFVHGVQYSGRPVYEIVIFYHEKKKKKNSAALLYHVSIDDAGNITTLKERQPQTGRGGRLWDYPVSLKIIAAKCWPTDEVGECGSNFFRFLANASIVTADGFMVSVRKRNEITARFYIDMLRTPYFFKDRIKAKTESGRTKPIFHIVRAHKRTLANASERFIKTHFRGVRSFFWNDYKVVVSMPGKHHTAIETFTASSFVSNKKRGLYSVPKTGRIIAAHMRNV